MPCTTSDYLETPSVLSVFSHFSQYSLTRIDHMSLRLAHISSLPNYPLPIHESIARNTVLVVRHIKSIIAN